MKCPNCGSVELVLYPGLDEEGNFVRRYICHDCGHEIVKGAVRE